MFSRRSLLGILGTSLFLLFARQRDAMASLLFRPKRHEKPRVDHDPYMQGNKAVVGVAYAGASVKDGVKEALSLIGGLERLKIKDKTVLVKPNCVSSQPSPATTNPKVISAVVELFYEQGAKKVVVGDMSALATFSTKRNMKKNGMAKAAIDSGAEVVVFEDYDWVSVDLLGAEYVKTAYVTEWLYKTDIIVNLPVIKTHRSASYSITFKNFIGCTHLKQRPYLIDRKHWEELVAEFNLACRPHLNIVDGTVSMIEHGPWEGTPAETNLIIASSDRVAADIVGLGVIKSFGKWEMVADKDVWDQRQIRHAVSLGVGKGKGDMRLNTGKGDEKFDELMENVRRFTGL